MTKENGGTYTWIDGAEYEGERNGDIWCRAMSRDVNDGAEYGGKRKDGDGNDNNGRMTAHSLNSS